jgi:hypothetical protein
MILEKVEMLIADHGLAVMGIFPDMARGLPALNYTVGLQDLGMPELVLTGVEASIGITVLNQVADWLKARGQPPAEGEIFGEGILMEGYQARFRALSPAEDRGESPDMQCQERRHRAGSARGLPDRLSGHG